MQLEFHQLDRRWEHLRVRHPQRQRRLLASLAEAVQQTPIVVVTAAGQPDRYLVIDGYKRIVALQQLGRDTVEAVGLAPERGRSAAPGPFAAPVRAGDRTGTGVAAGGVRTTLRIRTGGTGAAIRSERELGVAPAGVGRTVTGNDPTASAGRQGRRACGDEVSGPGGPHQPGGLRTDGLGLRTASLRIAASRAVVCRLAQWLGCNPQAHPRCTGSVPQNAAANGAKSPSGCRCFGVVARSGNGSGDCEPRSSPLCGCSGHGDERHAMRSGAAAGRASAPSTGSFGGANRKGARSTC